MGDCKKDEKLVRQTISRLLDFKGKEVAEQGGFGTLSALPESVQAPKSEHLELADTSSKAVPADTPTEFWSDDWGQMDEDGIPSFSRPRHVSTLTRQTKMAMLIPILSVVLLVVLNKFHGMPLAGSEWLSLGKYQTMVGDIVESGFSSMKAEEQHPVRIEVRGIAFSQDRPSAVVGSTIVHEGDIVLGATVVRITTEGVQFEVNGQTWTQKVQ
ncbi:MAG: hypothetical protein JW720_05345 [Sedimentisphaerales bacterium]|nr:hypothetical protein [Sedimentisphaerales bacterium]